MSEQRLEDIRREQRSITKKRDALYERQRSVDRLNDGIGTYFRKTQQLLQKTRETFRKNDGGREFDDIYSFFSRDAGKAMEALGEEKREIKREQQLLEEQDHALTKEKKKLYSEEEPNEH
ncbi:DUF3958 family protein [Enterococcus hulanensis]|uniref:DUF3958 family protein n=1 Tax=Enterococcus hulanensis TaxID=2559929 RepID=A0ABU3F0L9_9ENTE|nr:MULTISPECIES: DUF3958 family protein [Enterococcus]MBO0410576.1 DUF3958 family protein [Enterococcus hulanensis]MDT2600679.1 DUF3958 family protein [Enterococcus hulanensis]MDT2610202.1 DUF3958 family protein [Enterococcus hulanensis]MDT2617390.1 DUF3958 family protein [Enterococcus hulanensis]MDT2628147.1 DUF3958 family protein [Enterococcus hulanensis]